MKKIDRAAELMWVFGIIFVAFGVAVCKKADLGVSMLAAPAFVVAEALSSVWSGVSVGMVEYLIQGIELITLCVIVRRIARRYVLTFVTAVVYGYTLNLFLWILGDVSFDTMWLRWIMLFVGDMITAFGVACFFRTYLPQSVCEMFVADIAAHFQLDLSRTKWTFDISMLLISIVLAVVLFGDVHTFDWSAIGVTSFHSIGFGTFVTTAINSPLIAAFGKLADRFFGTSPRFPKLHTALAR